MTLEEKIKICRMCTNRKINVQIGIVCALTDQKPQFETNCPDFNIDEEEANRLKSLEEAAAQEDRADGFSLERKAINMGVPGGIILIAVAVIWFFAGLAGGYIFYYPPILLVIGIYALVKGIAKGKEG